MNLILGRGRVGPLCAIVSEHSGLVGVIACGVCLVFVGALICVVLLGVVAPAMSCGRFLLCTLLGEGLVFLFNVRLGVSCFGLCDRAVSFRFVALAVYYIVYISLDITHV